MWRFSHAGSHWGMKCSRISILLSPYLERTFAVSPGWESWGGRILEPTSEVSLRSHNSRSWSHYKLQRFSPWCAQGLQKGDETWFSLKALSTSDAWLLLVILTGQMVLTEGIITPETTGTPPSHLPFPLENTFCIDLLDTSWWWIPLSITHNK